MCTPPHVADEHTAYVSAAALETLHVPLPVRKPFVMLTDDHAAGDPRTASAVCVGTVVPMARRLRELGLRRSVTPTIYSVSTPSVVTFALGTPTGEDDTASQDL